MVLISAYDEGVNGFDVYVFDGSGEVLHSFEGLTKEGALTVVDTMETKYPNASVDLVAILVGED